MWPEVTEAGGDLHLLRLNQGRVSHGASTPIDVFAPHGGIAPAAFVHWTGRAFLVHYTRFADDNWRLYSAVVACHAP
jgi:hypothetical protein